MNEPELNPIRWQQLNKTSIERSKTAPYGRKRIYSIHVPYSPIKRMIEVEEHE